MTASDRAYRIRQMARELHSMIVEARALGLRVSWELVEPMHPAILRYHLPGDDKFDPAKLEIWEKL